MKRKTFGTSARPRLCVYRSNKHIYAQLVDDTRGETVTFCSSLSKDIKNKKYKNPAERAKEVGKLLCEKAIKKKVKKVVFDRRNYKFHGQVRLLAEGAREGGLKF